MRSSTCEPQMSAFTNHLLATTHHVAPFPHSCHHPLLRAAPRRPSPSPLLPNPVPPQTRHGQSRRHTRRLPVCASGCRDLHTGHRRCNVLCIRWCGSAGDERGRVGSVRVFVADGGVSHFFPLLPSSFLFWAPLPQKRLPIWFFMSRDTPDLENYRWSQWKMQIPYWLPVVNTGLAIAIWTIS